MRARGKGSSPGRVEGSSRAMLATARPSCTLTLSADAEKRAAWRRRDHRSGGVQRMWARKRGRSDLDPRLFSLCSLFVSSTNC